MNYSEINSSAEEFIAELTKEENIIHKFEIIQNDMVFMISKDGENIKENVFFYLRSHIAKSANNNPAFFNHVTDWFEMRKCKVEIRPIQGVSWFKRTKIRWSIKFKLWRRKARERNLN